tara:strand:+ start:502 stop:693 length:192 start_codon:yes stop_codon:yes gene_type:complete
MKSSVKMSAVKVIPTWLGSGSGLRGQGGARVRVSVSGENGAHHVHKALLEEHDAAQHDDGTLV